MENSKIRVRVVAHDGTTLGVPMETLTEVKSEMRERQSYEDQKKRVGSSLMSRLREAAEQA